MDLSNQLAALGLIGFLVFMLIGALGIVLTVLWILLPFSVFAIRKRLDAQQAVIEQMERHLAKIAEREPAPEARPLP